MASDSDDESDYDISKVLLEESMDNSSSFPLLDGNSIKKSKNSKAKEQNEIHDTPIPEAGSRHKVNASSFKNMGMISVVYLLIY
jgi:hypothetical protein